MEIFILTYENALMGEGVIAAFSTLTLAADEAHKRSHERQADTHTVYRAVPDSGEIKEVVEFRSGSGCAVCRLPKGDRP